MFGAMVIRPRLRSFFTALGLYALASLLISYFGVNAYTGDHGLRAREQLDRQINDLDRQITASLAGDSRTPHGGDNPVNEQIARLRSALLAAKP